MITTTQEKQASLLSFRSCLMGGITGNLHQGEAMLHGSAGTRITNEAKEVSYY